MGLVIVEKREGIALLTINRPEGMNALNTALLKALSETLDTLAEDREIRVLIVTGAGGRAFVAGADIGEMAGLSKEDAAVFARAGHEAMNKVAAFPAPTIAAVNGFALGGGFELALACDLIIASPKACFSFPETGLGITPGFGGTQRLSRLVGPMTACDLIFTGRRLDAEQARGLGIVAEITEEEALISRAREIAEVIASRAPIAIRNAKFAIRRGLDVSLEDGLEIEIEQFSRCFESSDQKEAMGAFIHKEKPKPFQGL